MVADPVPTMAVPVMEKGRLGERNAWRSLWRGRRQLAP
jgi:hypothetical protein